MTRLGQVVCAPLTALGFLTVLPVPMPGPARGAPMGWAVASFPLAGAAMGLALAALDRGLATLFPPTVAAALLLATLLAVTGALHLDGLMDSFDGILGGKDPASRLAIMKDSRVGSFGTAAAASVLLLEYASLASMFPATRSIAIVSAVVLSRWAMAMTLWIFPAATTTGLAAGLKPLVRWPHAAVAALFAGALAVSLGWPGIVSAAIACATALLVGRVMTARIGGITGDSCGATGMLVEALVLAGWTVWP